MPRRPKPKKGKGVARPSSHQTPTPSQTATPPATPHGGDWGPVEKEESRLGVVSEETENEDEEMKELLEPDWPVEKKVWRDASGQPLIRSSLEWNR